MYDRPETRDAQDRLWAGLREAYGGPLPETLGQPDDLWAHWTDPALIFSQTCGFPFRALLHPHVQLVGTPDYGLPDCPPGHYRSVFVMRSEDASDDPAHWAGLRLAFNDRISQSGWAAPQTHLAERDLCFDDGLETGSHAASIRAVAEGRADIAAIDARTWEMARTWDRVTDGLAEVGRTAPSPGLPLITGPSGDPAALAAATRSAIDDLSPGDARTLGLVGLVEIPAEAYLAVPTPPKP
ncbi:PhnD/SsuA/transferrin family substrate-binding protein [Histidinibacterium aquaticum]|uniref:PhnD/SsuA/transferrin family substrate-binding protein n=2 Tax=Histidinibacterium aquaticum TaxID=2613962 RepID=A0A5J5GSR3_9RHOB|nr:PhnD/SsuA/transferrin family substrate-binding protein [Histidinibacterium aquaticum]